MSLCTTIDDAERNVSHEVPTEYRTSLLVAKYPNLRAKIYSCGPHIIAPLSISDSVGLCPAFVVYSRWMLVSVQRRIQSNPARTNPSYNEGVEISRFLLSHFSNEITALQRTPL